MHFPRDTFWYIIFHALSTFLTKSPPLDLPLDLPLEFLQFSPRQSPQAATQFKPNFLHVHRLVLHGFLDVFLQLQRTNLSIESGATGVSVVTGTKTSSTIFQPQSRGFNTDVFSVFQITIWR